MADSPEIYRDRAGAGWANAAMAPLDNVADRSERARAQGKWADGPEPISAARSERDSAIADAVSARLPLADGEGR